MPTLTINIPQNAADWIAAETIDLAPDPNQRIEAWAQAIIAKAIARIRLRTLSRAAVFQSQQELAVVIVAATYAPDPAPTADIPPEPSPAETPPPETPPQPEP